MVRARAWGRRGRCWRVPCRQRESRPCQRREWRILQLAACSFQMESECPKLHAVMKIVMVVSAEISFRERYSTSGVNGAFLQIAE